MKKIKRVKRYLYLILDEGGKYGDAERICLKTCISEG